jgi:hypothetical protein
MPQNMASGHPFNHLDNAKLTTPSCPRGYLLCLLLSKSTFLTWVLRCRRVIPGESHAQQENPLQKVLRNNNKAHKRQENGLEGYASEGNNRISMHEVSVGSSLGHTLSPTLSHSDVPTGYSTPHGADGHLPPCGISRRLVTRVV